ncbi:MAG TPA: TRAM domain-containing protein [Nitrososphaeraceae archaeon]|nr:TRAM domain-containing protein [Nitrososphaeraceae archaeon]
MDVKIYVSMDTTDGSSDDGSKKVQEYDTYVTRKKSMHDSSFQYPVKVGEEYDVNILDMSGNGDSGVTRIRGLITFVRGTKPDDRVRIKIIKIGKAYARGQLIAYLDS